MKTIKQIANALGIDKQRVYRYIKRNHISEVHQEAGVMYYDEAAESLMLQHFSDVKGQNDAQHEAHQITSSDTVLDTVISLLQKELDIKNEQIRELNLRLSETTAALAASQHSAQAAQALHAGTMQQQLLSEAPADNTQAPSTNRPSFFSWFKR
jgi:hypothetical protein